MASKEDRIRKAAAELKAAIADAPDLSVAYPSRWQDLDAIAVSETGRTKVVAQVLVDPSNPEPVDPKVAQSPPASHFSRNFLTASSCSVLRLSTRTGAVEK